MNAPVEQRNLLPEQKKTREPFGAWVSPRKDHLRQQHQEVMREAIRNAKLLHHFLKDIPQASNCKTELDLAKLKAKQQWRMQALKKVLPDLESMEISGNLTLDEVLHLAVTRERTPVPPPVGEEGVTIDAEAEPE